MKSKINLVENKDATESPVRENEHAGTVTVTRFDIFKGYKDPSGKVNKIKSVGSAYIRHGLRTYTVHLKTFLKDTFYLLENTRQITSNADFVILTREPAQHSGKKYFWNSVGDGRVLDGDNERLMELSWDLLPGDVYLDMSPKNVSELPDAVKLATGAA